MKCSSRSSALSMRSAYSPAANVLQTHQQLFVTKVATGCRTRHPRGLAHLLNGIYVRQCCKCAAQCTCTITIWHSERQRVPRRAEASGGSPSTHTMAALASGSSSVSRFSHSSEMMPSYLQESGSNNTRRQAVCDGETYKCGARQSRPAPASNTSRVSQAAPCRLGIQPRAAGSRAHYYENTSSQVALMQCCSARQQAESRIQSAWDARRKFSADPF